MVIQNLYQQLMATGTYNIDQLIEDYIISSDHKIEEKKNQKLFTISMDMEMICQNQ